MSEEKQKINYTIDFDDEEVIYKYDGVLIGGKPEVVSKLLELLEWYND